jgi:hypothetical protein
MSCMKSKQSRSDRGWQVATISFVGIQGGFVSEREYCHLGCSIHDPSRSRINSSSPRGLENLQKGCAASLVPISVSFIGVEVGDSFASPPFR